MTVPASAYWIAALKTALAPKCGGCFLCDWILQDLEQNGTLTDHPVSEAVPMEPIFPRLAKFAHLWIEFVFPKTGQGIDAAAIRKQAEFALDADEGRRIIREHEQKITQAILTVL